MSKQLPRLQTLLLESVPEVEMNNHQIAGIVLALYSQKGLYFEHISNYFLLLDDDQLEQVLEIVGTALNGIHREPKIIEWLIKNHYYYDRNLEPLFKYLDNNRTANPNHLIQIARFVHLPDDLETFCVIANSVGAQDKQKLF